jgi:hypothetical protein
MSSIRRRFVYNQWVRDPDGPILTKPPPLGKRLANRIIWGHTINDFFWIQRIPGINVVTIWSRSMIQEFGENFAGEEHEHEPSPRQLRPWPILQLPSDVPSAIPLGLVDETCFCNHIRSALPVKFYDDNGVLREPSLEEGCAKLGRSLVLSSTLQERLTKRGHRQSFHYQKRSTGSQQ